MLAGPDRELGVGSSGNTPAIWQLLIQEIFVVFISRNVTICIAVLPRRPTIILVFSDDAASTIKVSYPTPCRKPIMNIVRQEEETWPVHPIKPLLLDPPPASSAGHFHGNYKVPGGRLEQSGCRLEQSGCRLEPDGFCKQTAAPVTKRRLL